MSEPELTLADDGNAGGVPTRRAGVSRERRLALLVTFVLVTVGLSCKSTVIRHERDWFFEGVNARWRYYADTLPMVVEKRLAQGGPSLRRNAAIGRTFGALCFYDPGCEDQQEITAGVLARTERQAGTAEDRERLHSAYRSGRKVSSRIWWQLYTAAMGDDTTRPWTFELADSMRAVSADLDFRMNPGSAIDDWRVKRKYEALQAELWRTYLQMRDSSVTKSAR